MTATAVFFVITTVLLIVAFGVLLFLYMDRAQDLREERAYIKKIKADYKALDQGMAEQAESYENEFLEYKERSEKSQLAADKAREALAAAEAREELLVKDITEKDVIIDHHNRWCLPMIPPSA